MPRLHNTALHTLVNEALAVDGSLTKEIHLRPPPPPLSPNSYTPTPRVAPQNPMDPPLERADEYFWMRDDKRESKVGMAWRGIK